MNPLSRPDYEESGLDHETDSSDNSDVEQHSQIRRQRRSSSLVLQESHTDSHSGVRAAASQADSEHSDTADDMSLIFDRERTNSRRSVRWRRISRHFLTTSRFDAAEKEFLQQLAGPERWPKWASHLGQSNKFAAANEVFQKEENGQEKTVKARKKISTKCHSKRINLDWIILLVLTAISLSKTKNKVQRRKTKLCELFEVTD